jgi:hypothetical protein
MEMEWNGNNNRERGEEDHPLYPILYPPGYGPPDLNCGGGAVLPLGGRTHPGGANK